MNRPTTAYRPDVDGLRAVAVLLVLLYHAGFPVSGGYVGVDVFFVISGYLITGIVWKEINEQRFSFKSFYLRRIKRLLPALTVVVLFAVFAAAVVFTPGDYLELGESLRYVLTGLGNFYFLDVTQSYFAAEAELLPLIHTWSLAVEEQFYVVWPPVLLLVYALGRRISHRCLAVTAAVVFLLALSGSEYLARQSVAQAYYLLPARVFELMLGGLLAVYGKGLRRPPEALLSWLSLFGLGLILWCAMTLTRQSIFPGFNAFWVCLGTALVIYAGGASERVASYRLLSLRPVVFIGLISYSLYLWHWPLVAMANYLNIRLGGFAGLLIIFASVLLAWLTWALVEQPVRRQVRWSFAPAFVVFFLLPLALSAGYHQYLRKTDGWPQRLVEPLQTVALAYLNDEPGQLYPTCHDKATEIDTSPRCYIGADVSAAPGSLPDFLLLGDSHANSAAGVFDELGKVAGLRGLMVTSGSSPFLLDTDRYRIDASGYNEHREKFRKRIDSTRDWIQHADYRGPVVLGAAWHRYLAERRINFKPGFEEALAHTVQWLANRGHPIIIYLAIQDIPDNPDVRCVGLDALDLAGRWDELFSAGLLRQGDTCQALQSVYPEALYAQSRAFARGELERITSATGNVRIIDPMDFLCVQGQCRTELEGRYIYHDVTHLNFSGGKALARRMLAEKRNPLLKVVTGVTTGQ
jgi:peptidoglycan/LPS O-acetylase OafA/YrhL